MSVRRSVGGGLSLWVVRLLVGLVACLAFLPLADWIPGDPGSNLPPPHWPLYVLWLLGSVVLGLLAWGLARLIPWGRSRTPYAPESKARKPKKKRPTPPAPTPEAPSPSASARGGRTWAPAAILFCLPLLLYSITAWEVFDGRPLHVDAMTQALQAHIFAQGRLSVPVADDPRFFSSALVVESGGRAFSQFPPGWAAILALGYLLGLPWLMAPLCGALGVVGLYWLLRENGEGVTGAFSAAVLMGFSPWIAFNSASWMSHVPTLCFLMLGSAALTRGIHRPGTWLFPFIAGVGLGAAALIRPLEGVAFGIPATVWVLARAWRNRASWKSVTGFACGGALALGLLLLYNWVQHGSPGLFGFELQWGPEHRLGFHEAPWGPPHTFLRGVQLLNGYLLGLQLLFFDAPAPSLLLALAGLLLARKLDALDRYLLAGSGLVLLGYLAFWGEGHDLGPRYLIPLAPLVAIWTIRAGGILAYRTGRSGFRRWVYGMAALLLASGWLLGTPPRWFVYGLSDPLRRVDAGVLEDPRASGALVFLSSPWSIQVQARLRATGMSRQEAQWFYYRVGLCKLDVALSQLEDRGVSDPDRIVTALRPLAADSSLMILDPLSGSPGDPYAGLDPEDQAARSLCELRQSLETTLGGYWVLPFQASLGPTWLEDGGPILAQDLHEEDRRLLEAYPDRTPYALRPAGTWGRIRRFRLVPLDRDSVEAVWGTFERLQTGASVF